jgi:hypothetical protein
LYVSGGEINHYVESNGYVNDNGSSEEDEEWEQVGPKKKSVVTRVVRKPSCQILHMNDAWLPRASSVF